MNYIWKWGQRIKMDNIAQYANIRMNENDANANTIKEYLGKLLLVLWREKQNFSSKRPFGNSDWEWELYEALVKTGAINGNFDEDGYLENFDDNAGDIIIEKIINYIFFDKTNSL